MRPGAPYQPHAVCVSRVAANAHVVGVALGDRAVKAHHCAVLIDRRAVAMIEQVATGPNDPDGASRLETAPELEVSVCGEVRHADHARQRCRSP